MRQKQYQQRILPSLSSYQAAVQKDQRQDVQEKRTKTRTVEKLNKLQ